MKPYIEEKNNNIYSEKSTKTILFPKYARYIEKINK